MIKRYTFIIVTLPCINERNRIRQRENLNCNAIATEALAGQILAIFKMKARKLYFFTSAQTVFWK